MSLIITPESDLGKELARWNKPYDPSDPRNQFPKMLYQAVKRKDGTPSVGEVDDSTCGGTTGAAEAFNRRCQLIVKSEQEEREALGRGWRLSPADALARFEEKERSIANAAAHRAYEDRNMSDAAKAEAAAADAATEEHLPEVPVKRGPGRPRKIAEA